jgi:tripartite-type tricarboxylate transporter receptor subunit TctC
MKEKMKNTIKKLLISAILITPLLSSAETTKLVVPVPPGGLVDNLARLMATELSKKLNDTVVVENKPGASGSIATSFAASAVPNGQTLLIGNNGTINMYPVLNPGFDGFNSKSFAPVCLIGGGPLVLTASGSIPANNLKELLQYFKENPTAASWASPGVGTAPHLLGEQLKFQYNINSMVHVLYKGMAPAQTDVIGNRVSLMFDLYGPNMAGLISAGKLKPIFVTDIKPLGTINAAPDSSFNIRDWFGLFTAAGTPEPILKKLQTACDNIVNDPTVKEQLTTLGTPPLNIKPNEASAYIDNERKRWTTIYNRLDLKENK